MGTAKHPDQWLFGEQVSGDFGPYTSYRRRGGGLVFFLRAPPTKPPSPAQTQMRNRWRMAATQWQLKTKEDKAKWERASKARSLRVRGYELFLHWYVTANESTVRTIERQTGISLID